MAQVHAAGGDGRADLQRGHATSARSSRGYAPRSPTSTSSSSTTTRRTAPAPWPTGSRPSDPQVHVLHRTGKEGLGAAYLRRLRGGARARLRRDRRDGRRRLPPARAAAPAPRGAADADLVIGSRWVPRRQHRELAAAPRAALARREPLHPGPARDRGAATPRPGFRLFRRTTLEADRARTSRVVRLRLPGRPGRPDPQAGLRVVEVPIEFVERERGESKMNRQVATDSLAPDHPWGLSERRRQATGTAPALVAEAERLVTQALNDSMEAKVPVVAAGGGVHRGARGRDLRDHPGRSGDRGLVDRSCC